MGEELDSRKLGHFLTVAPLNEHILPHIATDTVLFSHLFINPIVISFNQFYIHPSSHSSTNSLFHTITVQIIHTLTSYIIPRTYIDIMEHCKGLTNRKPQKNTVRTKCSYGEGTYARTITCVCVVCAKKF